MPDQLGHNPGGHAYPRTDLASRPEFIVHGVEDLQGEISHPQKVGNPPIWDLSRPPSTILAKHREGPPRQDGGNHGTRNKHMEITERFLMLVSKDQETAAWA